MILYLNSLLKQHLLGRKINFSDYTLNACGRCEKMKKRERRNLTRLRNFVMDNNERYKNCYARILFGEMCRQIKFCLFVRINDFLFLSISGN